MTRTDAPLQSPVPPRDRLRGDGLRWFGVAVILCSIAAFLLAPLALPSSYSVVEHTTSEAGAQGVDGAWVSRIGFVLFGVAVLATASAASRRWGWIATTFHLVFAACMVLVAVFSARSWEVGAVFDQTEDDLHSVAATAMGFAFAIGVTAVATRRWFGDGRWHLPDGVALVASVVLPLSMFNYPDAAGVLQRIMFAVAFLWYGRELLVAASRSGSEQP